MRVGRQSLARTAWRPRAPALTRWRPRRCRPASTRCVPVQMCALGGPVPEQTLQGWANGRRATDRARIRRAVNNAQMLMVLNINVYHGENGYNAHGAYILSPCLVWLAWLCCLYCMQHSAQRAAFGVPCTARRRARSAWRRYIACTYTHERTNTHTETYTHAYTNLSTRTDPHTRTRTHTHTHACTHARTHTYTHTHTG